MASNNFANAAAAVSAGYKKTQTDRGVAPIGAGNAGVYPLSERFQTDFELITQGAVGEPGVTIKVTAYGVDQNTADANAVTVLNAIRANRYGGDSTAVNAAVSQAGVSTVATIKDAATAVKKHTLDKT